MLILADFRCRPLARLDLFQRLTSKLRIQRVHVSSEFPVRKHPHHLSLGGEAKRPPSRLGLLARNHFSLIRPNRDVFLRFFKHLFVHSCPAKNGAAASVLQLRIDLVCLCDLVVARAGD